MAKLAFSKLGLKLNNQVTNIYYNEQEIEVKQYISVNDKLKLISDIINKTIDEHSFCNPVQVKVFIALGIIEFIWSVGSGAPCRDCSPDWGSGQWGHW